MSRAIWAWEKQITEVRGTCYAEGSRVQFMYEGGALLLYLLRETTPIDMGDDEHATMCMANSPVYLEEFNGVLVGCKKMGLSWCSDFVHVWVKEHP